VYTMIMPRSVSRSPRFLNRMKKASTTTTTVARDGASGLRE
jgi:hypothetical protein